MDSVTVPPETGSHLSDSTATFSSEHVEIPHYFLVCFVQGTFQSTVLLSS